jgi:hypothetical protein
MNGDGRGQAGDAICGGAFEPIEELSGRSGERLDVTTLALSVQRIKGQTTFPGPARPAQHCERAMRNLQCQILQVVDANAFEDDL